MSQSHESQTNILIVDDTSDNLMILKQMLLQKGYQVRPAISGPLALKAVRMSPPDLILLDVMMSGMDGYEVCRQLKADERTRDIPVLFISAQDKTVDKVKAFEVGGVDYIIKPFQAEEVLVRVKTHVALRIMQKQLQAQNTRLQREIRERKQTQENLGHRKSQLFLLNQVGQLFSSSLELDDVLETALVEVQRLGNIRSVSIWLLDPETDELVCMHAKGPGSEVLVHWRLKRGQGITGWVAQHGESVIIEDTWTDERHYKTVDNQSGVAIRSMLSMPLKIKGSVIGVMGLVDRRVGHFKQGDLLFLEPIATAAAAAIENARLYTTAQQEITERKQAETLLRSSEKKYRSIFENVTTGIFQTTLAGRFITVNPALAKMLGYASQRELMTWVTHIAEQLFSDPRHWYKLITRIQKTPKKAKVETRFRCKDGKQIIGLLNIWSVQDENGKILYFEGIIEDISERKRREQTITRQIGLLDEVFNGVQEGISFIDSDDTIIFCNPAHASILEEDVEHITGKNLLEFFAPEDREIIIQEKENRQKKKITTYELQVITAKGNQKYVRLTTSPRFGKDGAYIGAFGALLDITNRKQAEETLRKQANLLRGVAGAMSCLLVTTEFQIGILQAFEILGLGTGIDRIYIYENHVHPETGEAVMSQRFKWAQNLFEVQTDEPELQNLVYADIGLSRWYEMLSKNSVISGVVSEFSESERVILEPAGILSTIIIPIMIRNCFWGFIGFDNCQTERPWKEEEESILLAMAGSIGGAIARQEAEAKLIKANEDLKDTLEHLKQTQTQLVQSEKMAALGQLIAGVAHEINTPLGAIRSAVGSISQALTETLKQLPEFLRVLSEEQTNVFFKLLHCALQRDVMLTGKELRKFRRSLAKSLEAHEIPEARKTADILVDLGIYEDFNPFLILLHDPDHRRILRVAYEISGLQESTHIITTATERASKIVFALKTYARYDHTDEMLQADIVKGIETVLTLYHNQLKHGVEVNRNYGTLPQVFCYPDELNQVWTNLVHNALQAMDNRGRLTIDARQDDEQVIVSITDNGKGIPQDVSPKIFDPFFTTKPAGEGSGLGLDIVRKIVDKHQGKITFESEPGKTIFYVSLPIRKD